MSTINVFQISLEIWGCLLCLIISIILGDKAYKEGGTLGRIWQLLLLNGFLLISDAFAYIFRGETSTLGIYMTRISNFLVFFLEGIITWSMAVFVQELIDGEGKQAMKSRWIRLCTALVGLQLLGAAITPFTNFYYSFDATNHYHRGPGVVLTFTVLAIVCSVSTVKLFRHSRQIPTGILHVFRTALPIFAVCFVIQFLEYGFSLINVSLTLLLIMLYLGLWKESMNKERERQTEELENLMRELMSGQKEKDQ